MLVKQRWPSQCVAHSVLSLLPINDIFDFVSDDAVAFKHVLPPCEWEACDGYPLFDSIAQLLEQRRLIVGLQLRRVQVDSAVGAEVVEVYL